MLALPATCVFPVSLTLVSDVDGWRAFGDAACCRAGQIPPLYAFCGRGRRDKRLPTSRVSAIPPATTGDWWRRTAWYAGAIHLVYAIAEERAQTVSSCSARTGRVRFSSAGRTVWVPGRRARAARWRCGSARLSGGHSSGGVTFQLSIPFTGRRAACSAFGTRHGMPAVRCNICPSLWTCCHFCPAALFLHRCLPVELQNAVTAVRWKRFWTAFGVSARMVAATCLCVAPWFRGLLVPLWLRFGVRV